MVLSVLLVVGGCGGTAAPVMEATLGQDGRSIDLGVASCNADHAVTIEEESVDEVEVTVTATGDDGNDCMDVVTIVLQKELGDRTLVDGSTGDVIGIVSR